MADARIAVVTGANRGIGFEVSRGLAGKGFHVVMTARDAHAGAIALRKLQAEHPAAELRKLDVNSADDAQALGRWLGEHHRHVDVLVNNAGILPEHSGTGTASSDPRKVSPVTLMEIYNTNALGAVRLIQALAPLMRSGARIINVSSGMGALHDVGEGFLG